MLGGMRVERQRAPAPRLSVDVRTEHDPVRSSGVVADDDRYRCWCGITKRRHVDRDAGNSHVVVRRADLHVVDCRQRVLGDARLFRRDIGEDDDPGGCARFGFRKRERECWR